MTGRAIATAVLALLAPAVASAQLADALQAQGAPPGIPIPELVAQLHNLAAAAICLPLATGLGAVLAFRPRRSGTPPRVPAVIQTQILLALVGAVVMLVVGQSLARAFGIVGVASLVRYRAKVEDPKDAGVMLAALAVGLATGVGLYLLAAFATLFLLALLWWVESIEPRAVNRFHLTVKCKDPTQLKTGAERVLRRHRAEFELRSVSAEAICYEVRLPLDRRTDQVSQALLALDPGEEAAVEWEEKKPR